MDDDRGDHDSTGSGDGTATDEGLQGGTEPIELCASSTSLRIETRGWATDLLDEHGEAMDCWHRAPSHDHAEMNFYPERSS